MNTYKYKYQLYPFSTKPTASEYAFDPVQPIAFGVSFFPFQISIDNLVL